MRLPTLLTAILTSGLLTAAPKPEVRAPDAVLPYRKTAQAELKLEVFRPEGWNPIDQRPAIVFFFGGGWINGSTSQFHPQAAYFAKRGMVAICADYRIRKRNGTTPFDAVEDAKAALRWVWRNAKEQGIDPNRIISSGGSAGGHLAACCGVVPGYDEPKEGEPEFLPAAMVLFNPVIDTSKKGYGNKVLGDRWKELSPLEQVHAKTAPTLLMVGTDDTTTPPGGDKAFAAKMKELGLRCELELYEGEAHGFFNARGNNENYWKTLKRAETFLEELGFLKPASRTEGR